MVSSFTCLSLWWVWVGGGYLSSTHYELLKVKQRHEQRLSLLGHSTLDLESPREQPRDSVPGVSLLDTALFPRSSWNKGQCLFQPKNTAWLSGQGTDRQKNPLPPHHSPFQVVKGSSGVFWAPHSRQALLPEVHFHLTFTEISQTLLRDCHCPMLGTRKARLKKEKKRKARLRDLMAHNWRTVFNLHCYNSLKCNLMLLSSSIWHQSKENSYTVTPKLEMHTLCVTRT